MKEILENRNVITAFIAICGVALIYFFVKNNYIGAMIALALLFVSGPLYAKTKKPVKKKKKGSSDDDSSEK